MHRLCVCVKYSACKLHLFSYKTYQQGKKTNNFELGGIYCKHAKSNTRGMGIFSQNSGAQPKIYMPWAKGQPFTCSCFARSGIPTYQNNHRSLDLFYKTN